MDGPITINSRKFDQSIRKTWNCRLVERRGPRLAFVGKFDRDVIHNDLGLIKAGTVSHEFFWSDRWYNVFRFHEPDDELRNYYCNIAMPPVFENHVLDYVDLDIDVVVWKDRKYDILDLDDFQANSLKYAYPQDVISKAHNALDEVVQSIQNREFPFDF